MITLGLGLLAASIIGLTIESGGASVGALQRRRLDAPTGVGPSAVRRSIMSAHYQHRHASVH